MVDYFFDTYALIEFISGNPDYRGYGESPLTTTELNRMELSWWAMTRHGEELARIIMGSLHIVAEVDDDTLIEAIAFRMKHKKKDLSLADCVGYTHAQKNKMLFLTGDEQFKDMPGVEFVK